MDETFGLLHSGRHHRLCLTRASGRGQRSVNHVWKPVVSALWAVPGPPLPDTWHRAAPQILHAPASVSLRRLRVARVVQSRRFRAASVAAHASAGPLIIWGIRLRSQAVRPATPRLHGTPADIRPLRTPEPNAHGRGSDSDVRVRPTRQPSSGGGLIARNTIAASRHHSPMSRGGTVCGGATSRVSRAGAVSQNAGFCARPYHLSRRSDSARSDPPQRMAGQAPARARSGDPFSRWRGNQRSSDSRPFVCGSALVAAVMKDRRRTEGAPAARRDD
jgi:hypothetical protein